MTDADLRKMVADAFTEVAERAISEAFARGLDQVARRFAAIFEEIHRADLAALEARIRELEGKACAT
ncbi:MULTISPECIES: hypothetical protein [unclassified Rhizobium]|uniref:hypothetical protein n=1 Tax=unclassified Rhizobium TaxID=2613769 RepID=UPI00216A7CFE|nr:MULTISPECIES: hypothetical protein [unclassified Rhizobium]MCS3742591.1 hypothetical protein [Rhizobium sp. BK661]MCS4094557.1 hypothetical protein [Rhizobium sp. BK176]